MVPSFDSHQNENPPTARFPVLTSGDVTIGFEFFLSRTISYDISLERFFDADSESQKNIGLEIKSSRVISSMTSSIYNKEPEITPEDLISRPMFYCDSESASKNLSNDI